MQLTKKSPRVLFQVLAFFLTFLASKVKSDHEGSSDPLDWLRDAIPGEPGVDYPILAFVGDTSFSCADRVFGGKIKHFLNSATYYGHPERAFLQKSRTFGFGRHFGLKCFEAFGVFSAGLSAPILVL